MDIKNFTKTDYLAKTEFFDFTQDENLILYFATNAGIISYDSKDFQQLSINSEIDNKAVKRIFYYKNSLHFSTVNATYQYNLISDSLIKLNKEPVLQFHEFDNTLYYITHNTLGKLTNDSTKVDIIYKNENNHFNTFIVQNDEFTIGTNKGLLDVNNSQLIKEYGSFINAKAILKQNDSTLMILSENAVFEYNQNKIIRTKKLIDETAQSFFSSETGNLWIATDKNLYQYAGIFSQKIKEKNGFNPFEVYLLKSDLESNLWILGDNGLTKITLNQPFTQLKEKNTHSIYSNENSVLLVKQNALIQYKLNFNPTTVSFQLNEKITDCSATYNNGEWIIVINSKHIYKWNEDGLKKHKSYQKYIQITPFKQQNYLVLENSGQLSLLDNNFNHIKSYPELKPTSALIKGKYNNYVILENNSIFRIKDNGEVSTSLINLTQDVNYHNLRISNYGLWSFSKSHIQLLLNDGSFFKIKTEILKNDGQIIVHNLFEDSDFNLWVSFNDKLAKISLNKTIDQINQQKVEIYDRNNHIASSYFKQSIELENQQIWLLNEENITIYNPLLDNPIFVAPGIKVESAKAIIFDEFKNPKDTINISINSTNISTDHIIWIQPNIINHSQLNNCFIEYRNTSKNGNWIRLSNNEKIILKDLPTGQNKIEIQAVTSNGLRSHNIEKLIVNVKAPLWKSNWFYIGSLSAFLLLGFIGYRTINNYKDNRAKELHEKLDKELGDLERRSHLQILKSERLKQLNELITSQKGELEKKNKQIESQKYELSLTNDQIKKQKDLLEETGSKLKASINYAQRIQNALMSTEVEIKKAIDESFVFFMPRDVVSGDFYWFNKVINDKGQELQILAAVDCTGHGVPGAIVSVVGITLLNNITNLKKIYEPGKILNELNADIIHNLRQSETQVNDGMDMTIVSINKTTREILFAGAKNPIIYVEDGKISRIRGDKHAIGGQQRGSIRDFQTHTIDCSDNKLRTFYLFSDGYQDQFGGDKGFKFLTSNFKELLLNIHQKPVFEQKEALYETIQNWKADYAQTDDILVMGFKF